MPRLLSPLLALVLVACTGFTAIDPTGTADADADTDADADADSDADTDTDVTIPSTAPTAVDDAFELDEGTNARPDILANDTDPNDALDVATIVIVDEPVNGEVTVSAQGMVQYQHDSSDTLSDSFTYTVDNLAGETSNIATVSVTVLPVEDMPSHLTEAFYPTNSEGQYCDGDALVHWAYMGEMNFDDCQDLANRTGTQWYAGQWTDYTSGWVGDQDGVGTAAMTGANWMTEDVVSRFLLYSCVLGQFEHRTQPTVNPQEQFYVDGLGRTWHYWDLSQQTASQAIAFADDRGARIINPTSVGLNVARMTAPTHWCHASAEFNGPNSCNTDVICDFMVGFYE